jgi:outer membrane protein OmpU
MKKVLLTTTALVMTAGVAAAEVSFSGKGQVAMGQEGGADMDLSTHIDFNVAVSGAAENGVTFATSFGYDAGTEVDYNDDFEIDDAEAGTFAAGAPEVAIGFNGWTITAQNGGIADQYDGDVDNSDISLAGSIGGVAVGFSTNVTGGGATSYSVSYSAGDMTAAMQSTTDDGRTDANGADISGAAMNISLSYKLGDVTLSASSDNDGTLDTTNSFGVSYAMGSLTLGYTMAGDNGANMGDDYDMSVGYTAGPISASFATNEESRTRIVAEYDLGGATAFFSSQQGGGSTELSAMGINFAF